MRNNRSIQNHKINLLANISESLECDLESHRYGLLFEHGNRTSKWLRMDSMTCALLLDIVPMAEITFDIDSHCMQCFHSLFILNGNVGFGGFEKNGFVHLTSGDFLYFHTKSHTLDITIEKGQRCQMLFISHSFPSARDFRYMVPKKDRLQFGQCEGNSLAVLEDIFGEIPDGASSFLLKGALFELMGQTLPKPYAEILRRRRIGVPKHIEKTPPLDSSKETRYAIRKVSGRLQKR